MGKRLKRVMAAALSLTMVIPAPVFAGERNVSVTEVKAAAVDMAGHWAAKEVGLWQEKQLISGYEDGSFKPDQIITRAEFVTLLNRVFQLKNHVSISYSDVDSSDYYYSEFQKAAAAGYIEGYADGTVGPNQPISRQEAAVLLYRVFRQQGNPAGSQAELHLKDVNDLAEWSKGAVQALVRLGYISGYSDQTFKAGNPITRAEAVKLMNGLSGEILNKEGTYSGLAARNAVVSQAGVVLKDTTIEGDLFLTEGIGEGEVTLENVTVKGRVFASGGGENSIKINNSEISRITVDKKNGKLRIVTGGSTSVSEVYVISGVKLEEEGDVASGFENVFIDEAASSNVTVQLLGDFNKVEVRAATEPEIKLVKGVIAQLELFRKAGLVVEETAAIKDLIVTTDETITVSGSGKIEYKDAGIASKIKREEPASTEAPVVSTGGGSPSTTTPASTAPVFEDVSVHDPSVIKVADTYYVFGSHLAAAKTKDWMKWTKIADGVNASNPLFDNVVEDLAETLGWAETDTLWAADVIQLEDGKYYMYYNACQGSKPLSAMGVAVADHIEGPYVNKGIFLKSGMNGVSEDGTNYDVRKHPNVVDPDAFFDENGKLWMLYGSYSGGIFIMEMDPVTGFPVGKGTDQDQGYGKRLLGGDSRIEASYMLYSPETDYYYMFLSFGGFASDGGYNIRVLRSENPDGPYYDAEGYPAVDIRGPGTDDGDSTIAQHGVKLVGNYLWKDEAGHSMGYVSPGHNSAYYDPATGKYFNIFHTRFPGQSEAHQVRVHQMFMNADGWPVLAPYRYGGETIGATSISAAAGDYQFINHGKEITKDIKESVYIRLNEDGTISGKATGTWTLSGNHSITLTIGEDTYKGVFLRQWDPLTSSYVMTFSALSDKGIAVWGSRLADKTDAAIAASVANTLSIGDTRRVYNNLALPTEGYRMSTITWASSNAAVVASDGVVTRPAPGTGNATVQLTATITHGQSSTTKTFTVTVVQQASEPLLDGLLAEYNFEGNLNDQTNSAGAGTVTGNKLTDATTTGVISYGEGVIGAQAAVFNGETGVKLPNGLISTNTYTVSMWLNPQETTRFTTAFFGARTADNWLSIVPKSWDFNTMLWSKNSTGTTNAFYDATSGMRINTDQWTHVAFTVNSGTAKVYINGAERYSGANFPDLFTTEDGTFSLGVNWWDVPFKGKMDDVRIYELALTADKIAALANQHVTELPKGLVAQYSFEGSLSDSEGNFITGEVTGTTLNNLDKPGAITYTTGVKGSAAEFNGASGVYLGSGLINGEEYSVSMWLQPKQLTQHTPAFFGSSATKDNWMSLVPQAWDNNTMLWSRNGSWFDGTAGMRIPANEWSNVTFTVKQGTFKIYINGELKGTKTGLTNVFPNGNSSFGLGVNYWDTPFKGVIDELQVYNTELSATDVLQLSTVVNLNVTEKSMLPGDQFNLVATVLPANAANKSLLWVTSNPQIATVADGVVTATGTGTGTGTAIISAISIASGDIATATITVTNNAVPVTEIQGLSDQKLLVGRTYTPAGVTVLPAGATNKTITWSSSNEAVATVNAATGTVTALSKGTAVLTASAADGSGVTASYTLTVDDVVVRLNFEGNVQDNSGNGQNATVGNNRVAYVEGRNGGQAVQFLKAETGTAFENIPVVLPNNLIAGNEAYTVSAWVKWNGVATGWAQTWSSIYFSDTFVSVDNPLNYYMNMGLNGDIKPFIGRPFVSSTVTLPTGQWAHVAMTVVPGGKTSLYLNGTLIAQTDSDTRTTQGFNEHFLGGNFWDQNFNGAMDDFVMYSRALTAEEIAALAAAQ